MMDRSAIAMSLSLMAGAAARKNIGTASGTASMGWVGGSSRLNPSRS